MEWKPTPAARLAATVADLFDNGPEKVGHVFWGFLAMGVLKKDMEYCVSLPVDCLSNMHL